MVLLICCCCLMKQYCPCLMCPPPPQFPAVGQTGGLGGNMFPSAPPPVSPSYAVSTLPDVIPPSGRPRVSVDKGLIEMLTQDSTFNWRLIIWKMIHVYKMFFFYFTVIFIKWWDSLCVVVSPRVSLNWFGEFLTSCIGIQMKIQFLCLLGAVMTCNLISKQLSARQNSFFLLIFVHSSSMGWYKGKLCSTHGRIHWGTYH